VSFLIWLTVILLILDDFGIFIQPAQACCAGGTAGYTANNDGLYTAFPYCLNICLGHQTATVRCLMPTFSL
jgi:hypothetical protein